jgi:catechol 2,3-dioxygenase-like lactoylglutathione lyase family enzyme
MVTELGYDGGLTCSLDVANLDASIAWYQGVLGFKLIYKIDALAWCELASPVARVNVGLGQVENKKKEGGNATLVFGVHDIDSARKALESHKVRFDGPTRTYEGMVKLATFYDPDGNTLMLYQDLAKK